MRLVCPNCDAHYEVPDEVIPSDGRDVQCSDCGQTWFQSHPDHMPQETDGADESAPHPDAPAAEEERSPTPEPKRRTLDPAISGILREEAEAESRVRQSEALESQPDLGLGHSADESPVETETQESARRAREAREARDRMAKMRGQEPPADTFVAEAAAAAAAASTRRDLLPDIEEINSTLRSTGDRQISKGDTAPEAPVHERKKRGFRRGFFTSLLVVGAFAAAYVYSPQIIGAMPAVEPAMAGYVGTVDQGRIWLDSQVTSLLTWLDTTAEAQQ